MNNFYPSMFLAIASPRDIFFSDSVNTELCFDMVTGMRTPSLVHKVNLLIFEGPPNVRNLRACQMQS